MIAAISHGDALLFGVSAFVILCALACLSLVVTLFIVACAKLSELKAAALKGHPVERGEVRE